MSEEKKEMLEKENPEMKSEEIPEEEIDQAAGGLLGKNKIFAQSYREEMGINPPKNFIG